MANLRSLHQPLIDQKRPSARHSAPERRDGVGRVAGRVRPNRIALFGMFGGGNFGNDASLEAMLAFLREARPDAEIICICVDPVAIGTTHGIATVSISHKPASSGAAALLNRLTLGSIGRLANWARAIRTVGRCDLMIVPGTATLNDFRSGPFGTPYGLFRWAAAARLCRVPFCFVSTGAGPIGRPLSRWMLRRAARWAQYRSFRDQESKDFLSSLGIDTSTDPIYPDLVFRLPVPDRPANPAETSAEGPSGARTIAVGVMSYYGREKARDPALYQTYLVRMGGFILDQLRQGRRVRLLIGETVDREAVRDIGKMAAAEGFPLAHAAPGDLDPAAPERGVLFAEPIGSLHDIMRQLHDADILVATRFHNVVCALKLGLPTISVGYEAKNDAVMAAAGMAQFCHFIEDVDPVRLSEQAACLMRLRNEFTSLIRDRVDGFRAGLAAQEAMLSAQIV
ncbi:MAG: polysaccharide pyruvyl transferase family protein [Proteobacteria bacterium]|nr:polysaccharide pyruvyl transferase family protein [Pseudomonadota bacterium]